MASIRKRTWKSKGVEQTAWVVDYFDQAGARHLKTFKTKGAATDWMTTALHEVKQGTHTAASASIAVAECWRRWIDQCDADGLEFGTIRQRRQHLNLHVEPFIGREKLSDLTVPRIHQFDAALRKAGRSLAMRRKVLTNVKTMLSFAQTQGLVAQNVARGVRIKNEDRHTSAGPLREGVDFPSKAELKLIIDGAAGRWRPLLTTAIFTGMRASELRGLSWHDVDLEAGMIHVRQRADAWGHIGPPKSKAGKRDIPLAPMVVNVLRQWLPDYPKRDTGKIDNEGKPVMELELVFPNGAGNVESLKNIWQRCWTPLQRTCGLSSDTGKLDKKGAPVMEGKYGFHMLRHAAASLFIAYLGWTPKRVQSVMGHSSINMTFDLYGHLFEDRDADREAMQKIEAAVVAA
jgi:integrase